MGRRSYAGRAVSCASGWAAEGKWDLLPWWPSATLRPKLRWMAWSASLYLILWQLSLLVWQWRGRFWEGIAGKDRLRSVRPWGQPWLPGHPALGSGKKPAWLLGEAVSQWAWGENARLARAPWPDWRTPGFGPPCLPRSCQDEQVNQLPCILVRGWEIQGLDSIWNNRDSWGLDRFIETYRMWAEKSFSGKLHQTWI